MPTELQSSKRHGLKRLAEMFCRRNQAAQTQTDTVAPWRRVLPWIAAGFITLTFVTFPSSVKDIGVDGDVSWSAVLNYAHQHGLQFGTDIVFTFGPLGFLITPYFFPYAAGFRMFIDVALCFTVSLGLLLITLRLRRWWGWLLPVLFVFAAANLQQRIDLVLNAGLLCWGLLCFVESGRRQWIAALVLAFLAAFSALAKISYLVVGGLSIIMLASNLGLGGRRRLGALLIVLFGVLLVLGWVATGQSLWHFGSFLMNSLAVMSAYNKAMGWEGLPIVRATGFVLVTLMIATVALQTLGGAFKKNNERGTYRQGLVFAWLAFLTFVVWKHGFVREDFLHPAFFLGFVPVLVLALRVLPGDQLIARKVAGILGVICCIVAPITLQYLYFPAPRWSLSQPLRAFAMNLGWVIRPWEYIRRMTEATEVSRREAQLPEFRKLIGQASTGCFGQYPVYVLFNDFHYRPAPVFQSYAACDDYLMRLNEKFYRSSAAPEYVLFSLNPVDRRFPAVEDARALRDLLLNYEPVALEAQFLLLKRISTNPPKLTLLHEATVQPHEPINLSSYGETNLWLEIEMEQTWAGRLREVLYRPPLVRLAAWKQPRGKLLLRHRAPAGSMAAGFLASPLLVRNEDVLNLHTNKEAVRPGAYSVELTPGEEHFWQKSVRYRVYEIEGSLGNGSTELQRY
jgi:hypothetical protein